ncbi:hypothetical protein R3W88_012072 [Solanum pinnatisectum]|uniref:Uncharacterized protein n=1 Tax=Solanum pinnatisectum TaxID=50273 RepID=A0AAV9L8B5_9SOLN|nr:hypothetical protein R3W88_012072 [Solanum pinnatisectum]
MKSKWSAKEIGTTTVEFGTTAVEFDTMAVEFDTSAVKFSTSVLLMRRKTNQSGGLLYTSSSSVVCIRISKFIISNCLIFDRIKFELRCRLIFFQKDRGCSDHANTKFSYGIIQFTVYSNATGTKLSVVKYLIC